MTKQPGKTLICVIGPTAIGKTRLAIEIARAFDTEILSADSRQFFHEMRIGTAVPDPAELAAAPHHFIQHLSVRDPYTVGDYEQEALTLLNSLFKKKDVVVLVGGSALYVDAVTRGLDQFPKVAPGTREALETKLQEEGIEALQEELKAQDPEYYEEIDRNNPHRLIRALEVCRSSGKPFSSFRRKSPGKRPFQSLYIGLTAPREVVYGRIERRVDQMLEEGLVEEARSLYALRDKNALQTVGYKELFEYFDGEIERTTAIEKIKRNTRRFAKRQLTWYRKRQDIHWFDYDSPIREVILKVRKLLSQ